MTSLKTSIKTITYLSDIGCLEIQGASLCTVRQIAVELKRHPVSVINKLVKYLDDDSIQNRITQDFYDVPVRELVRWW